MIYMNLMSKFDIFKSNNDNFEETFAITVIGNH